jgi:ABC-type sugar transport system ATPase subunit
MLSAGTGRRVTGRRPAPPPAIGGQAAGGGEALRIVEVTKWYGGVLALDHVSMSVDYGEVVALVGDNGAGKSTLVNIIAGVVGPDEAEIYVRGKRVAIRSTNDAASLGIRTVHQEHTLADNLDVVENLFMGRELLRGVGPLRRVDFPAMQRRTRTALSELGITTISNIGAPVAQLSGGQRQIVAVARANLANYGIVLLDEPTAGLGVAECGRVMELVLRLRGEGSAIVVVSQNIDEIFEIADRIVVLHLGRVGAAFRRTETTPEAVMGAVMGMA